MIIGAVFDRDGDQARDVDNAARRVPPHNRVAVPTHFYKIIFNKHTFGADEPIAILLPHDNTNHSRNAWTAYITANITTIGEIEKMTGMHFLPNLSATKLAALENYKAPAPWPKE